VAGEFPRCLWTEVINLPEGIFLDQIYSPRDRATSAFMRPTYYDLGMAYCAPQGLAVAPAVVLDQPGTNSIIIDGVDPHWFFTVDTDESKTPRTEPANLNSTYGQQAVEYDSALHDNSLVLNVTFLLCSPYCVVVILNEAGLMIPCVVVNR